MTGDVRSLFAELGIHLPQRNGENLAVRCFANEASHKHGDRHPSASVNVETGAWCCHACGAKGGAYDAALALGRTPAEAMALLERHGLVEGNGAGGLSRLDALLPVSNPSRFRVSDEDVSRWHEALLGNEKALSRLSELRGWTREAAEALEIGLDAGKVTFPYRDAAGRLVGLGRYQPNPDKRDGEKLKATAGSLREPYPPLEELDAAAEPLFLVEGEADAVLATSLDLDAVGLPGAASWRSEWASRFAGRRVVVVMDCDSQGRSAAQRVAADLARVAAEMRVLDLDPTRSDGFDLTDWTLAGLGDDRSPEAYTAAREALLDLAERAPVVERETAESAPEASTAWPVPLGPAAYQGVAGEFARLVEPHTEADPAAVLTQFLTACGNLFGRRSYVTREATRHAPNLFVGVVGNTSRGRKGSSLAPTRLTLHAVDGEWEERRVKSGLSSGEGLIYAVRDASSEDEADAAPDRRLLLVEDEFSSPLRVMRREGNTLSPVLRRAWDGRPLSTLTRNAPLDATDAHVSVIGHVTNQELSRELTELDVANGFANRFIWILARRSKSLPRGGRFHREDIAPIARNLAAAVEFAATAGEADFDEQAGARWDALYPDLTADIPGLLGAVTARAEAQVTRLALIYALLGCSKVIRLEHLEAALEVWRYSFDSARVIFGERTGDADADRIAEAVAASEDGLTRTEIRDLFGRNAKVARIDQALALLESLGRVERTAEPGGQGRPAERVRTTLRPTTETTKPPPAGSGGTTETTKVKAEGTSVVKVVGRKVVEDAPRDEPSPDLDLADEWTERIQGAS